MLERLLEKRLNFIQKTGVSLWMLLFRKQLPLKKSPLFDLDFKKFFSLG